MTGPGTSTAAAARESGRPTVTELRTDGLVDPVGRGLDPPRLAWSILSSARATTQSAYRVEVTFPNGEVVWDSGRVDSERSVGVPYGGPSLEGRTQYAWRVRVWTSGGEESAWSDVATWETALAPEAWRAAWIRHEEPDETTEPPFPNERPAAYLRRQLTLEAPVERARAYVTALGLYELYVNGARAGSEVLTPGWTDYTRRVQYQTMDVTALLRPGENTLGAVVADGWYAGRIAWVGRGIYGLRPAFLCQLEVELEGGAHVTVCTDESWLGSSGAVRGADLLEGETRGTGRALEGWGDPSYDASRWSAVRRHGLAGGELVAEVGRGVRVVDELEPTRVVARGNGIATVDFGQNAAGWVRLRTRAQGGRQVTIRHGEALEADGTLHTANLRSAAQTDSYTVATDDEVLEPSFTYHGFRFAEVAGIPDRLAAEDIRFRVISSAVRRTGRFECSDPLLNDIQRCIVWGQRSNFVSVPTDCPQRDERLGWTGDAQIFAPTAAFNFDVCEFFRKWLVDLADAQHPSGAYPDVAPMIPGLDYGNAGWADAGVIVPWALYVRYGDERLLTDHYESMRRYAHYLVGESTTGVRSAGRYGDWVSLGVYTSKDVIGTAFAAHSLDLMRRIAETVGHEQDAVEHALEFERLRTSFVRRFVDDEGRVTSGTQTAYLLALHMGLTPSELAPKLVEHLVADIRDRDEQLTTGFLGTPLALPVLSDHGEHELACRLAQKDSFPSWGFHVRNGATTMWERWDGWSPETGFNDSPMNSFNHYAFGSVGDWLYSVLGGLAPSADGPGYRHSVIRPRPGGTVTWARTELDSRHGRIEVSWRRDGGRLTLDVELPANTSADVELPAAADQPVLERDTPLDVADGVRHVRRSADTCRFRLGSGVYSFTSGYPSPYS